MAETYDDHPSMSASLDDFAAPSRRSPLLEIPSQHSGFRSESEDESSPDPAAPWSPPGFHRADAVRGSGWYRREPYPREDSMLFDMKPTLRFSPAQSREPSPQYEDALEAPLPMVSGLGGPATLGDITLAANVPLPPGIDSPLKGRSVSPEPPTKEGKREQSSEEVASERTDSTLDVDIRFALRAEVQHREPFVALFNFCKSKFDMMTSTRTNAGISLAVLLTSFTLMRVLLSPAVPQPVPDLVKLSTFSRSFEPLIHYSENGVQQIGALQETGIAVWDLGESVRGSNMTSAPIIVKQLDELSESLKSLSLELTRFFAAVDSDVDSILLVMDWARRELQGLSAEPPSSLPSIMIDNIHTMISYMGSLEHLEAISRDEPEGAKELATTPTYLGAIVTGILGPTSAQRTRNTLVRTFTEFLNVLEESINSELTHSSALFALFESIDHQFLNLQRTVVRESDAQERAEGEMLSSLWTRVLGANAALVRKYDKNRKLLASVRSRTVANKHLLMDHQGRLLTLKVNLETLRRKLVSPLVRRNDSINFHNMMDGASGGRALGPVEAVIESQITSIDESYGYLRGVREKQKAKFLEMVYGAGRPASLANAALGIDDSKAT